jgi:hypothetical protein
VTSSLSIRLNVERKRSVPGRGTLSFLLVSKKGWERGFSNMSLHDLTKVTWLKVGWEGFSDDKYYALKDGKPIPTGLPIPQNSVFLILPIDYILGRSK